MSRRSVRWTTRQQGTAHIHRLAADPKAMALMVWSADPFQSFRIMREVVQAGAPRPDAGVASMFGQCRTIEPKIPRQIRSRTAAAGRGS